MSNYDKEENDATSFYLSGMKKLHEKKYEGAIVDFDQAISFDPTDKNFYEQKKEAERLKNG